MPEAAAKLTAALRAGMGRRASGAKRWVGMVGGAGAGRWSGEPRAVSDLACGRPEARSEGCSHHRSDMDARKWATTGVTGAVLAAY